MTAVVRSRTGVLASAGLPRLRHGNGLDTTGRTGRTPVIPGRLRLRSGLVPGRHSVLVGAVGGDRELVGVGVGRSGAGRGGLDRVGGARIFGGHGPCFTRRGPCRARRGP